MTRAISLYLDAEEVLSPILQHAGSLGRYDGKEDLLLGTSVCDAQSAVVSLRNAAGQEYLPAKVMLGECLYRGIGVQRDDSEAKAFFLDAEKDGDPNAQFYLGRMHHHGDAGLEIDFAKAFQLYTKSAEHGNANAQNNLGDIYLYGRSVEKDEVEAVEWYRKAAGQGNPFAQNNLGFCYAYGQGVAKDEVEAVKWYRKGAEQGGAHAQNSMGDCYYYGTGVEEDEVEAVKWYRKAAEQGGAYAQNSLGDCYYYGTGVVKDEVVAAKWFKKAAEQGNATAQNSLGECFYFGTGVAEDEAEAVKWYRKSAGQGTAYAQNSLGDCYKYGQGVTKDDVEAVKWYLKAAEQGNADAQCSLGGSYRSGTGVAKDKVEAAKWFKKAAEQGNAAAQNSLGICYKYGTGVAKDEVEAVKWYRKAAEQGSRFAQNGLGDCYKHGQGVVKDEVEAVKWYRKAAEQGNATAQNSLGECFYYGKGVAKDEVEAVKWYRKAAEQGNFPAQYSFGFCYKNGRGVAKDEVEAVKWYRKAAEQGNATAQNSLGVEYYNGGCVAKDEVEAVKWYRKAAEQGNVYAQNNLGICYEYGKGVVKNLDKALVLYREAVRNGYQEAKGDVSRIEAQNSKYKQKITDETLRGRAKAIITADSDEESITECSSLMEACTPGLYLANAFRVVGLHVDAKPKDIRRRIEDLKAVEGTPDWGKEHRTGLLLSTLPTPEEVQNALLRLQDPETRMVDEFFWFWPLGSDACKKDKALQHFQAGECEQAFTIWRAASSSGGVEAVSATHNLAIYYHALAIEGEWDRSGNKDGVRPKSNRSKDASQNWLQALEYWETLVDNEMFWKRCNERVRDLDDARLSTEFMSRLRLVFPVAFDQINAFFARSYAEIGSVDDAQRHLQYMSASHLGLDDVEQTISMIVNPIENRVKMFAGNAISSIKNNPEAGLKSAKELLGNSRKSLNVVTRLLGNDHELRRGLCDEVASAGLACLIQYGNKTLAWQKCMGIFSEFESLACSAELKAKIKENVRIGEENVRIEKENIKEKELRETCWFCKQRPGTSFGELSVKMYGDVTRTPYYGGTHIEWRNATIKVPRCDACREAHEKTGGALWGGMIIGAVVGSIIFIGIGTVIGFVIGLFFGALTDEKTKLPPGVSPFSSRENFPPIKELGARGWNIGEKPSQ